MYEMVLNEFGSDSNDNVDSVGMGNWSNIQVQCPSLRISEIENIWHFLENLAIINDVTIKIEN